jgi:DNA excision repair protein ERCC-3
VSFQKLYLFLNIGLTTSRSAELIEKHEACGDKILVFVDNLFDILVYSTRLKRPHITGKTPKVEKDELLRKFVHSNEVKTLFLTRTGDESLNLPNANVVIQASFHHGCNIQESQRLGNWQPK